MNAEVSRLMQNLDILDQNGDVDRDKLFECFVSAFEAGRRSAHITQQVSNIEPGAIDRLRKLAGLPNKDETL